MDAAVTKTKLETIAKDIEAHDPDAAANMYDLGNALAGGPTADAWAFSDIRSIISPERLASSLGGDPSTDLLTRGLEVLRNSLVLLPLAITWFGIALAVNGYYNLIGAHPELAGQSFIYLWQGGFEGRTLLPLGTLALIDGFLLAGVFFLTLLAYARSAWVSTVGRQFGDEFERVLGQALTEAELILAPRRGLQMYNSIYQLEDNLQNLLKQVGVERQRIDELAQRRERELGDLEGITEHLQNTTGMFLNAIQLLASTQSATLAGIDGVDKSVKGLAATQRDITGFINRLVEQQKLAEQRSKPTRLERSQREPTQDTLERP